MTATPDVSPAGGVRLADEMGDLVTTAATERGTTSGPAGAAKPITEVARRWGFADPAGFSRSFRATYGTSPSAYRARWMGDRS